LGTKYLSLTIKYSLSTLPIKGHACTKSNQFHVNENSVQMRELSSLADPVSMSNEVDSWVWSPDVSRGFTVKSTYSLVAQETLE